MTVSARRAREQLGRLALVALIVALVVGCVGGIDAVAQRMLASGVTAMLDHAEPDAQTVRLDADQAADPGAQDTRIRTAIDHAFAGADIVVTRQVDLTAPVQTADGGRFSLQLRHDHRIPDLARLIDGAWPRSDDEFALPEPAARRADLVLGDVVTVDGRAPLTLCGTWTAKDAADPAWHGDPAVASGESSGVVGPGAAQADALDAVDGIATVTWEIALARTRPDDLPVLIRAVAALQDVPDAVDPQHRENIHVSGELGSTLRRQSAAVAATRGLLIVPPLIVALLGALVLGAVLRTLALSRAQELSLMRARGASGRRIASTEAGEIAAVAALGALAALAALLVTTGISRAALGAATAAILLPAAAAAMFAVRSAGRIQTMRSDAGMRSLTVVLLPASFAAAVAALPAWQLFSTGAIVAPDGTPDPLAAAAPAALLVAACALAPLVAVPLAAGAERLLRRTRGISPILPLRQLARRMGGVAVAILCLTLASASVALAAAAPAYARSAEHSTRAAVLAGDVRMVADEHLDVSASDAGSWSGVTSAVEVTRTRLTVGDDDAVLVAAPPGAPGFAHPLPGISGAGASGEVPAEITRSLADRLGSGIGTVFTAQVRFAVAPVRFRVARIVDAVPTVGDGLGVAVDVAQLSAAGAAVAPDELWMRSTAPADTANRLRAATSQPVSIFTAAQVSAAPVTSVAPAMLTAGALAAGVLGAVGFVAAALAASGERREEPLVLRALGLAPRRRRAMRWGELGGIALYAVLAGAALGMLVAAVALPTVLRIGAA